jgi:protein involved in plasmid replication-relaxation
MTGGPGRSYLSARGLDQLRERLSERDLEIVRRVVEWRLLSARQIQALCFPTNEEHANEQAAVRARQRVLARLCRERLLVALDRRVGGVRAGSAGLVLAPGPIAHRVLGDSSRRRAYEPSIRFFAHTLAVSQLVVDVMLAARSGALELLEAQAEPACWRSVSDLHGRRWLKPDAFLSLAVQGYDVRWWIEIDKATESLTTVLDKCRLYAAYRQTGREQASGDGAFPRVCWVVPDEVRAARLRQAIAGDRRLPDELFVVGTAERAVTALCSIN